MAHTISATPNLGPAIISPGRCVSTTADGILNSPTLPRK
jgi:hypothetical protein